MVLITSVSQILGMEEALGMSAGHGETRALVERCLEQLEGEQLEGEQPENEQ
jgi:TetR/AcrR family transcriptional regulator